MLLPNLKLVNLNSNLASIPGQPDNVTTALQFRDAEGTVTLTLNLPSVPGIDLVIGQTYNLTIN